MLFPPTVIEDFKRRLAGLEIVDATSPSVVAGAAGMDVEPSPYASPSESPAPPALSASDGGGGGFKSAFRAAAFAPAVAAAEEVEEQAAGVDGEAYDDDLDGAVVEMEDVDGAPAEAEEDVDGAPAAFMEAEEDVDGAAVEADVDGEEVDVDGAPLPPPPTDGGERQKEPETLVLDDEDDGEAMELASDEDDIFA
jgi:hypothetical protein